MDEFLKELFEKKITVKFADDERNYQTEIIRKEGSAIIEQMIREFFLKNHDSKIGELEAKVNFYEEMIKKSNFSPFIKN